MRLNFVPIGYAFVSALTVFLIVKSHTYLNVAVDGNVFISGLNYSDPNKISRYLYNITDNITLIENNPNICQGAGTTPGRLLVALIHTARSHFSDRQIIRNTWGSTSSYRDWDIRIVFLMGGISDLSQYNSTAAIENEKTLLGEEQESFGDLVIGDFIDTYRNLTFKHLMGYQWILGFCPHADFVLKTDDDMYLDTLTFIDHRTNALEHRNESQPADIYCHHYHDKPTRCTNCSNAKWFSTLEEWPGESYPPYCLGNGYGITVEWIRRIYSVRHKASFFWVDDVFVMGQLKQIAEEYYKEPLNVWRINANVSDKSKVKLYRPDCDKNDLNFERLFGIVVFLHRGKLFERDMKCLWEKTVYDHVHHD